ncbi:MAG: RNA polymerase sigma factor [Acidobacteria bacterium]|nr:RNA polymerase sigma factor [Acidobacteriota bacterium]
MFTRHYLDGDIETLSQVSEWILQATYSFRQKLGDAREDLVQSVHQELITYLSQNHQSIEKSFKALVWRIATHRSIDWCRRQSRHPSEDLPPDLQDGHPQALQKILSAESAALVARVMMAVKKECRDIWLRIAAGDSYQEIASALQISAGSLRVKALRCRNQAKEIRQRLEKKLLTKAPFKRHNHQGDAHDL